MRGRSHTNFVNAKSFSGVNDMRFFAAVIMTFAAIGVYTLIAFAVFWYLTMWTQIPVSNDALWVGLCILCAGIEAGAIGKVRKKQSKKQEQDA